MSGRGGRGGRGGGRFGGRQGMLQDVINGTREDLGLSYAQMESLVREENDGALYPPVALPRPGPLSDSDANLIQHQRLLAYRTQELYAPTSASEDDTNTQSTDIMSLVHVTLPENAKSTNSEVFVPEELISYTQSGIRKVHTGTLDIIQPRAFEKTLKSLEAAEKKKPADGKPNPEHEDTDLEEHEEDLGDDADDYTHDYYDSDGEMSDAGDEEVCF